LVLVLTALGCAAPRSEQSAAPDQQVSARPSAVKRVVAAFMSDPPALMNRVNTTVASGRTAAGITELHEMINSGLTAEEDGGRLHPVLADAVPTVENGMWRILPDGSTETEWRIRESARWHDGAPFTSEDILFTARFMADRELPFLSVVGYDLIDRIEAADAWTFTIKWKRPQHQRGHHLCRGGPGSQAPPGKAVWRGQARRRPSPLLDHGVHRHGPVQGPRVRAQQSPGD
jgi:ABC-type transport system substrate-binding protein